jgi:hypothetical protein
MDVWKCGKLFIGKKHLGKFSRRRSRGLKHEVEKAAGSGDGGKFIVGDTVSDQLGGALEEL